MNFSIPKFSFPTLGRANLLVCETDGFMLHAAVVRRVGNDLAVLHTARAQEKDLVSTLARVVEILKHEGWTPGGKAVLLSPGVTPALLDFPANPGKPLSALQINALVGYELEPVLLEFTNLWSMGRMLVGSGAMTRAQAREIIDLQAGRNIKNASDREMEVYTFKRFGDMAMEAGYITRAQLDEALERQAWFKIEADDLACGWSRQGEADNHRVNWLVAGTGRQAAKRWVDAFKAHGIKLDALYPMAGCALAALPAQAQLPALVLEVRSGIIMGARVEDGHVASFTLHKPEATASDLDLLLEVYHDLTPPDATSIWLAGGSPAVEQQASDLAAMIGREVELMPWPGGTEVGLTPGMAGVARHAMGMAGAHLVCEIPAEGPRIPIWQQPQFRLAAAGVMLVLLLGVAEAVLQTRQYLLQDEHKRVSAKMAEFDAAKARVQAEIDKVKAAKDKIKAVKDEMAQVDRRMGFYGGTLAERSVMVQLLLEELAATIPGDVVIDKIEETPRDGFRIYAWSVTERGATQFVQTFKETMAGWEVVVEDVSLTPQQGRYNLPGFAIKFEAVAAPASPATPDTSQPQAGQPGQPAATPAAKGAAAPLNAQTKAKS